MLDNPQINATREPSQWFAAKVERFASRIKDLTPSQSRFPVIQRACSAVSRLLFPRPKAPKVEMDSKWGVHVGAEHMAQGSLSGNYDQIALQSTINALSQSGAPVAHELRDKLAYALKTEQAVQNSVTPQVVFRQVQGDVKKLEIGKSLTITTTTEGHSILTEIKCTGVDADEKKRYSIIVHNAGDGLRYHHSRLVNGRIRYQTSFEIENVSEESLCGDTSVFFSGIHSARTRPVEYFYTVLLPSLDGHLAPARLGDQDRRLWSHGQFGGSCSASSPGSFIRSYMTPQEFKEYKDSARMDMFLIEYEEVRAGTATDRTINIAQEIGKKLFARTNREEMTPALSQLQQTRPLIEAKTPQKKPFMRVLQRLAPSRREKSSTTQTPVQTSEVDQALLDINPQSSLGLLSRALLDMKKGGVHTLDRHQRLTQTLLDAQATLKRETPSDEGRTSVKRLAAAMTEYIKSKPILTKDEIYLYTAMISLLQEAAQIYDLEAEELKEFNKAHGQVLHMYRNMGTVTKLENDTLNEIIQKHSQNYRQNETSIQTFERYQQATKLFSEKTPLSEIKDPSLAIAVTERRLQEPGCDRVSIICELIAKRDVDLPYLLQKIPLNGLEEDINIMSALLERLKTGPGMVLDDEKSALYDKEFTTRFKLARQAGLSWSEAVAYGRESAYYLAKWAYGKFDMSESSSLDALSQAKLHWQIPQNRMEIIQALFKNQNVSTQDILRFFSSRTALTPQEMSTASQLLKERFHKSAHDLLQGTPEEQTYEENYTNFYDLAVQNGLSSLEAHVYADSCAKEYLSSRQEAAVLSEAQRGPDGVINPQPMADQEKYFLVFAEEYLKKMKESKQLIHCGDIARMSESEALTQAQLYLSMNQDRKRILRSLFSNPWIGISQLLAFVESQKDLLDDEVELATECLKRRISTFAKIQPELSPKEREVYEQQYAQFLKQGNTVHWMKAHIFADSCAREYIRMNRENSEFADVYIGMYADSYLDQLKNPANPASGFPTFRYDPKMLEQAAKGQASFESGLSMASLPSGVAFSQAESVWNTKEDHQNIIRALFSNPSIQTHELTGYINSKKSLTEQESALVTECMKKRAVVRAKTLFEPPLTEAEQQTYESQYNRFLQQANVPPVPWQKMHAFADSCAREYIQIIRQDTPAQDEYMEVYAHTYLNQLTTPTPQNMPTFLLPPAPSPEVMEKRARETAVKHVSEMF